MSVWRWFAKPIPERYADYINGEVEADTEDEAVAVARDDGWFDYQHWDVWVLHTGPELADFGTGGAQ